MSAHLVTPAGDAYSVDRIGGVRATDGGFLLLGNGADEILEWTEAPTAVALAWRDHLVSLLSSHRPRRPLKQLDWLGIAASVDPQWAAEQGWQPADAGTPVASPARVAAPQPAPLRLADRVTPEAAA